MKKALCVLAGMSLLFFAWKFGAAEAKAEEAQTLNARQKAIAAISVFTSTGELEKLQNALTSALDSGLTVNEIKEVLVQLYAYMGFPKSLNGIHTFMAVLEDRRSRGIQDETGREASPIPANLDRDSYGAQVRAQLGGRTTIPAPSGYQVFAPVIDAFLKQHLFADIFARDVLDFQSRELATCAALASVPELESQLRFHMGGALNMGLSEAQMREFVSLTGTLAGHDAEAQAASVLDQVLAARKQ